MAHIHAYCLRRWIRNKSGTNRYTCEVCKQDYDLPEVKQYKLKLETEKRERNLEELERLEARMRVVETERRRIKTMWFICTVIIFISYCINGLKVVLIEEMKELNFTNETFKCNTTDQCERDLIYFATVCDVTHGFCLDLDDCDGANCMPIDISALLQKWAYNQLFEFTVSKLGPLIHHLLAALFVTLVHPLHCGVIIGFGALILN